MGAAALIEPIHLLLALALSGQSVGDDPDYPLGKLGVPPLAEPATPLRLVDLEAGVTRDESTTTTLEARMKLGARAFFGGELRGDRVGAFFDTHRIELGFTEDDGRFDVEGALRAPFFLLRVDASGEDDVWALESSASVRLSSDWEVLLSYASDSNDGGGGPPSLEEFIRTGNLPPPAPATRPVGSGALGFLYQKDNDFELETRARVARVRTESGFELTRNEISSEVVWNRLPFELDGAFSLARTGRVRRSEGFAEIGIGVRVGSYFLVTARTAQAWQPDVERSLRSYRAGVTFFGRRFRFARASDAAVEMMKLQRRVNALGYNERRVYELDELRAFRDRLSISRAHGDLAEAIEALYLAQVRERNVPQLGVEVSQVTEELRGSTTRRYRAFVGVPWPLGWPFSRGEARVELVRFDFVVENEEFESVGWTRRAYEAGVDFELDRQHIVSLGWMDPGQTPEELALRVDRSHRFTIDYVYALGR